MTGAAYNALGAPTRLSFGNGLDKINRYFGLEALAGQTASYGKLRNTCVINAGQACIESTATALFNTVYDYDNAGNVTVMTDVVKSDRLNAAYDALNRLTSVTQDGALSTTLPLLNEAYTNDKIGNMTSKAGVTITAPATARYGFEAYNVFSAAGQCYCFAYAPNTGAWVFSGAAGVSENGTCLTSGNPPTPHMTRTAFLQTGGRMAITVTGLTVSETYRIGFVMARRGNYNAHLGRTFTATMGGQNLGMYSPLTTTWEQALTGAVVANATSLQLVLEAGAEPGNDSMALIDDVAVMPAHPHAARAMGNGNSFGYDANGNMTVRREKLDGISYVYTQTWTIDNRLAIVVKSDVTGTILATTTIAYDGDGLRVKKTDPSGTTLYLGTVEVLISGTTQVTTSYYAFGGAMVAMRTTATATLTYLHGDHLGTVSLTTNASGQKVSEQRHKPYGEVRWTGGSAMPTDFTFTGQRASLPAYVGSLMDYNARFYSPALGRFISADTIVPGAGNPAAFNRYSYVVGNPLRYRDPSGHKVISDLEYGGGGGGFAGLYVAAAGGAMVLIAASELLKLGYYYQGGQWNAPENAIAGALPGELGGWSEAREDDEAKVKPVPPIPLGLTRDQPTEPEDRDEWEFVGYHGTSSFDAPSIVGIGRVTLIPESRRNYGGGQLGPGFYTAKVRGVAELFAEERVNDVGGAPVVLSVYARGATKSVPAVPVVPSRWWKIRETDPEMLPPSLASPISGNIIQWQRKFNPISFPDLKVEYEGK